jgi:transposase
LGPPAPRLHRPQRGPGRTETVRRDGLQIARDLFAAWDAYQADNDRARLQAQTAPLQEKLRQLLEGAARKSPRTKYHRDFARNLLKRWPALWTFTHTDAVEPTNNHAERGLRGAVIYRKLSLGSQSEQGERTIERLLSTSLTCRLRKQSLFDYLTQALTAHARGDPVPTLT